ncbi:MAG: ABC transporter ATP-binding protein [Bosea sp. (in: a-proteobacteria)]
MAEALLTATGIGHRYGEGPFLFRNLDIAVSPGMVTAILGPNGKGKTTLLTCLAGLKRPAEGKVQAQSGLNIAYVPQAHRGGLAYRVLDMVLMGRAAHVPLMGWPGKRDKRIAADALARVGALHLVDRAFHELSGGEKSLVLIARALAGEAKVVILDEPFAALDIANQQTVLTILSTIVRKDRVGALITTHQPQHALALDGNALVLDGTFGHIQGKASDILSEALLARVFRMPVARVDVARDGRNVQGVVPMFAA